MFYLIRYFLLSILITAFATITSAQGVTKVRGNVYDGTTGEALAFVNVIFQGTSVGTTTDLDGHFEIDSRFVSDSLCASFLGFEESCVYIKRESKTRKLEIRLQPKTLRLVNVEIIAKKGRYSKKNNPAVDLMRKVIKNKKANRLEGQDFYSFDQYEKIGLDLNNITEQFKEKKIFGSFDLLWNYLDTSEVNGKVFLPIFLRESNSKIYYRNTPESRKEYRHAVKSTEFYDGLDDKTITDAMDFLYQDIDIYDNTIPILDNTFISPISNLAINFYRFYILDTLEINNIKSIRLGFIPKNKSNFGFTGDLFVSDDSLNTVVRADFGIIGDINLNFVRDLKVRQDFTPLDDAFVLTRDEITIDFSVAKNGIGFYGSRSIAYDNFEFKEAEDPGVYNHIEKVINVKGAFDKEENYWNSNRMVPLTDNQEDLYEMIDTLTHLPAYRRLITGVRIISTGYLPFESFDLGPLPTFYSFNQVEGSRVRLGMETNLNFNKNILVDGYGAYGFRDKKWKYKAGLTYSFNDDWKKNPRHYLRLIYQKDVTFPGQELQFIQQDNLLLSFRRGDTNNMFFDNELRIEYTRETPGFAMDLFFSDRNRKPYGDLFLKIDNGPNQEPTFLNEIETTSFGVTFEYAPNKQFIQGRQYRRPIINKYPILTARYQTSIKGLLGSQYGFHQVELGIFKRFNLSVFGHTNIGIEVGKIWGDLPYTELFIPPATQSFAYQRATFNLMNFLEFVSDQHMFIRAEHFFKGYFFNRIPLLKKLQLREIVTFKLAYGSLSDGNNPALNGTLPIFDVNADGIPLTSTFFNGPYMEGSVGISNIFKFLRIDLVKRFNYLEGPDVPELFGTKGLGIRAKIKIEF